jgi:hypothetical protein
MSILGVESARPEEQPMLVSVQEVQNHIEDLRKDLASAVKRAQLFKAHGEIAQREKKTVLLLQAQIKALTRFKKVVAKRK